MKVFGLYRSGTTYLEKLLSINNLYDKTSYLYKHTLEVDLLPTETKAIAIYKKPGYWLDSIQRQSFDLIYEHDILWRKNHTPIIINVSDDFREDVENEKIEASIERLALLYKTWKNKWKVSKIKTYYLDHYDLCLNPKDIIYDICDFFDVDRPKEFLDYNGKVNHSRLFTENIKTTYISKKYENLTKNQFNLMEKLCDE